MERIFNYRTYFFTYETDLPAGIGFSLFDQAHLLWLAFCVISIILYLKFYVNWDDAKRMRADKGIGIFLVGVIVLRTAVLVFIGKMSVHELPLHLCSLAGLFCLLHAYTKWDWLGQVLYALCLPGTLLALIFPNGIDYPAIHFITIESFLFHDGIVIYILCQLLECSIIPRISALWKVVVFLLVIVPPIYFFDKKVHANYMFVNGPSPGSPLEWMAAKLGNPGYLWGYAVGILLCMIFMDLMYFLLFGKGKKDRAI